jgi:hypothetical protein
MRPILIAELKLADPGFRTASRIVAYQEEQGIRFALQYQHDGEPGAWIEEGWFPWHGQNFDAIVRAVVASYERFRRIIQYEKRYADNYDH